MIVRLKPLTTSLVHQLADLARTDWTPESVGRFLAERGWAQSQSWSGYETGSGHLLVAGQPEEWPDHQARFHVSFCYFKPDEDSDFLGDEFDEDGWELLDGDSAVFNAQWQQGCTTVSGELGAPELVTSWAAGQETWNFAAWRLGDRALVVAQGEEVTSYGAVQEATLRLVNHDATIPFPEGDKFYGWLLGEG